MPTLKDKAIVAVDSQFLSRIPHDTFSVIKYVDSTNHKLVDFFIAVAASSLPEHARDIEEALESKHFRILFLRDDIALDWLPEQLLKAKLPVNKLLPKLLLYSDWSVPERVIRAWADDSQHTLIANAFAKTDILVVSNCALEKIEVPFKSPVLCDIPIEERSKFEIDDVGSFIHWPSSDTDLDFDTLRYLVDPEWKKKCDAEQLLSEQGFGYAVKGVRDLENLTQADIESRTGISERQLRRYETEGIKPRVSSLEKLAKAHGLSLNSYLERLAKAVNGPTAIIVPCKSLSEQQKVATWLESNFTVLSVPQGQALILYRPRGSKGHDIWRAIRSGKADTGKDQLALAVRVDTLDDFQAIWSACSQQNLSPDTAVGMDRWPSIGFVPATTDYVMNKLRQRQLG
jgi:transcriptional regulator with XRE-family HTH domain